MSEMSRRTDFLKNLDTKSLVERLHQLEDELELSLTHESDFKRQNAEYLASYSSDCKAVDEILASLDPPLVDGLAAKFTVDQRKSWLTRQRTETKQLAEAINHQHDVAFQNENNRIKGEMLVRRLEGLRAVIALKTIQIRFLTSDGVL